MTEVKISKEKIIKALKEQVGIKIKWPEMIRYDSFDAQGTSRGITTVCQTAQDFIVVELEDEPCT